jgi:hypothetical protein
MKAGYTIETTTHDKADLLFVKNYPLLNKVSLYGSASRYTNWDIYTDSVGVWRIKLKPKIKKENGL